MFSRLYNSCGIGTLFWMSSQPAVEKELDPRLLNKLCSTQPSIEIFLLINVKMPIIGILTFMSRKYILLGLYEPEKDLNFLMYL